MKLLKWEWYKVFRDWKSRILLIGLFLIIATYSTFYQQGNFPSLSQTYLNESHTYQNTFNSLTPDNLASEQGAEIDRRLARNQSISGMLSFIIREEQGNTVAELENVVGDFVEQSKELNENIIYFYEQTDFPQYSTLINQLPPLEYAQEQYKFFEYLDARDIEIDGNPRSPSMALFHLIQLISGMFIIILIAAFGGDSFSRDFDRNWSVSQGLPVSWASQWRMRTTMMWVLVWIVIVLGMFVSYFISTFRADTGTLLYPVPLYQGENIAYVSVIQYTVILTILTMMISYIAMQLAVGLSWIFRNVYLTVTIVILIFSLPFMFLFVDPISSFNPLLYLQVQPALTQMWYPVDTVLWKMLLSFLIIFIIIELFFTYIFTWLPARTGELKRRKN